jgi:hypothetical protein
VKTLARLSVLLAAPLLAIGFIAGIAISLV